MNPSTSIDPPAAKLVEARGADDDGMNRFAALLIASRMSQGATPRG
jgi:hypothetical protein